jgi:hypothetical protein
VLQGWIKLHRKILCSDIFQNEKLFKVFMYCLLKATHSDHEIKVGRQKVKLTPGQFVFGRKKAALELDMKESSARDYFEILKEDNVITIKSTNKYSVITVVNWDIYQSKEEEADSKSDSKSDNKATAERQQIDTNKNGNKGKNEKNEIKKIKYAESVSMLEDEFKKLVEQFGEIGTRERIENLNLYKGSTGKKYKNDYLTILSWERKNVKSNGYKGQSKQSWQQMTEKTDRDKEMFGNPIDYEYDENDLEF